MVLALSLDFLLAKIGWVCNMSGYLRVVKLFLKLTGVGELFCLRLRRRRAFC